jgi:acetate kinase
VKILALNPGSSSLKQRMFEFPAGVPLDDPAAPDAAGIRVVHGGSRFVAPARIDQATIEAIRELSPLAPLHNPRAADLIGETQRAWPGLPIVAVFDTAFHQTLPPRAFHYAIPSAFGGRRYGFHGISYSYLARKVRSSRHVACHLGNGASICAMLDGRSIDTSMGFTPLEGLMMGTRAGDIDPGLLLHLLRSGTALDELDTLLNERSGLLAVSERSGDMRELESAATNGDAAAALAIQMFAYRVSKYIGAYAAALGGIDALTFTAGIGEHSAFVRTAVCAPLGFLGIEIVEDRNRAKDAGDRRISRGRADVWVIATNEELEIARMTFETLA